jgi:hypothetical protein
MEVKDKKESQIREKQPFFSVKGQKVINSYPPPLMVISRKNKKMFYDLGSVGQ